MAISHHQTPHAEGVAPGALMPIPDNLQAVRETALDRAR